MNQPTAASQVIWPLVRIKRYVRPFDGVSKLQQAVMAGELPPAQTLREDISKAVLRFTPVLRVRINKAAGQSCRRVASFDPSPDYR